MQKRHLYGAIIVYDDEDLIAATQMLSLKIREFITYVSYTLPNEINLNRHLDFIIVSKLEALRAIQELYRRHAVQAPRIIHFYNPHVQAPLDYAALFPDLRIDGVAQASLDRMDVTLNYDAFLGVIKELQQTPAAVSS